MYLVESKCRDVSAKVASTTRIYEIKPYSGNFRPVIINLNPADPKMIRCVKYVIQRLGLSDQITINENFKGIPSAHFKDINGQIFGEINIARILFEKYYNYKYDVVDSILMHEWMSKAHEGEGALLDKISEAISCSKTGFVCDTNKPTVVDVVLFGLIGTRANVNPSLSLWMKKMEEN